MIIPIIAMTASIPITIFAIEAGSDIVMGFDVGVEEPANC